MIGMVENKVQGAVKQTVSLKTFRFKIHHCEIYQLMCHYSKLRNTSEFTCLVCYVTLWFGCRSLTFKMSILQDLCSTVKSINQLKHAHSSVLEILISQV